MTDKLLELVQDFGTVQLFSMPTGELKVGVSRLGDFGEFATVDLGAEQVAQLRAWLNDGGIAVSRADLLAWRAEWLALNDPRDGTDCVTPFDSALLSAKGAPGRARFESGLAAHLAQHLPTDAHTLAVQLYQMRTAEGYAPHNSVTGRMIAQQANAAWWAWQEAQR